MAKRILFQALDRVFRPVYDHDTKFREEPVSVKKLLKGDARWTTSKIILGWLLDMIEKILSMPEHWVEHLLDILRLISPIQRSIVTKVWHKVLGELRSISIAIPGCTGLFSVPQEAFCHEEKNQPRLWLTKTLHGFRKDFCWLAHDLASCPTCIMELIPNRNPSTKGTCVTLPGLVWAVCILFLTATIRRYHSCGDTLFHSGYRINLFCLTIRPAQLPTAI